MPKQKRKKGSHSQTTKAIKATTQKVDPPQIEVEGKPVEPTPTSGMVTFNKSEMHLHFKEKETKEVFLLYEKHRPGFIANMAKQVEKEPGFRRFYVVFEDFLSLFAYAFGLLAAMAIVYIIMDGIKVICQTENDTSAIAKIVTALAFMISIACGAYYFKRKK